MWQEQAKCRDVETEVFFPTLPTGRTNRKRVEAVEAVTRAYCKQCPVIAECLADALSRPEQHGIWGGMTEDERLALRAKQGRAS